MKKSKLILFITYFFLSISIVSLGSAQERTMGNNEMKTLKKEIQGLRDELEEQREEHSTQIERLQEQVNMLMMLLEKQKVESPKYIKDVSQNEIEALRAAAKEATQDDQFKERAEEKTFKSGGLSLQTLNPEISVTGDFIATYKSGDAVAQDFDFMFRGLGLHFESYLDPYTRFKAAVPVSEGGAELGEAYFTRYGIMESFNLTLGKFRQQFGVVNRWHKHALDCIDFPMPLRMIFGEGGLNQTGLSFDWSGTIGDSTQELVLQFTDGVNGRIFGENDKNRPSILLHYKNYRDLSADTYFEFGLTGLFGWNDTWRIADSDSISEKGNVQVYGADMTLFWEPASRMRYRNFEWRTELYYVNKEIFASDASGKDELNPWGAYTSFQSKISRVVDIGFRADYYSPETKEYADMSDVSLYPLAVTEDSAYRWLTAFYVTWHQSPFVKYRLEFNHEDGKGMLPSENRIFLQAVFAAGPHKHERY